MTTRFAFNVSLVDMIRKIRYRYEHEVDYLDSIIERGYEKGAEVDIKIGIEEIVIESTSNYCENSIDEIEEKKIMAIAAILPPLKEYKEIKIRCGKKRISIDENRKIEVEDKDDETAGFRCEIKLADEFLDDKKVESYKVRLQKLYEGSDMNVTINEKIVSQNEKDGFDFERDGFSGTINYNPNSNGGLHYYVKGRWVDCEKIIEGVNINLHEHGFLPTVTKSRIMTKGNSSDRYKSLEKILPSLILEYLKSPVAQKIKEESIGNYQTLLRTVIKSFGSDDQIYEYVKDEVVLEKGETNPFYLRYESVFTEVSDMLKLKKVCGTKSDDLEYDSKKKILYIPNSMLDEQTSFQIASLGADVVTKRNWKRKRLFRRIVKYMQD